MNRFFGWNKVEVSFDIPFSHGEKYIVTPEDSYGYADKNRGKDFTSPRVWLSSNNLVGKISGKKLRNRLWNGGNGRGTVKLYRDKKLIDEVICENVGCEYGEYDS